MTTELTKLKQNQTPRIYEEINGFELRTGKFFNPNEGIAGTPPKWEIRILHTDPELIEVLRLKLMEMLKE